LNVTADCGDVTDMICGVPVTAAVRRSSCFCNTGHRHRWGSPTRVTGHCRSFVCEAQVDSSSLLLLGPVTDVDICFYWCCSAYGI